jgi:integrase
MLKLVRRHGSPCVYLRGTVRGIRVDETTGVDFRNKKAAQEVKARRHAELLEESIHGKRAIATFSQAALSYIEAGGETLYLEPIIQHFGTGTKLAVVDQNTIDLAVRKLYPNHAPSTMNRQGYTPISAVLHHAARRGWCNAFTIERMDEGKTRVRWLSYDEADRLTAAASSHMRPLVIFLLYTGARIGEALWLDWHNVDLDRKHVQFIDTKNGTSRGVPLHPRVIEVLRGINHCEGCVFRTPAGGIYRPLDPNKPNDKSAGSRISTAFQGAVRRAKLTDFSPHDCRHTWATWHYQANRDLGALQRLGGWKTLSMVMRYAHTNVAELDQTIERLR